MIDWRVKIGMIWRSWNIIYQADILYLSYSTNISVTGTRCPIASLKLPLSKYWRTASALRDFTMRAAPMPWRSVRLFPASCHLVWCHPIFSDIRGLHRGPTGLLQRNSQQNGTIQSGNSDRKKFRKLFEYHIFPIEFFLRLNITFPISAWWPGEGHCW